MAASWHARRRCRQQLEVPGLGDPTRPPVQIVSRARLTEIIRPRVEEILQLARARIDLDRLPVTGRRLVLTGGGSQLEASSSWPRRRSACRRGSAAPACSMPAPSRT